MDIRSASQQELPGGRVSLVDTGSFLGLLLRTEQIQSVIAALQQPQLLAPPPPHPDPPTLQYQGMEQDHSDPEPGLPPEPGASTPPFGIFKVWGVVRGRVLGGGVSLKGQARQLPSVAPSRIDPVGKWL